MIEKLCKFTGEQVQAWIFYGLAVVIFCLPVPHLFFPESEKAIGLQATFLVLALFYFGFLLVVEVVNKRFRLKEYGIVLYSLIGLSVAGVLSVLVSEDKAKSVYGTELRAEGLLTLFAYYLIFIAATRVTKKRNRSQLLRMFLLLGVAVVILGLIQFFGIYVFGNKFPGMAYVPMRNPNFYGAFAVLFTGVGMGGFFVAQKESEISRPYPWWNRWIWYILVLVGYAGCICARSALVYAGLIMMLFLYLFLQIGTKRKDIWSFFLLVLGLVALIFLFDLQKSGGVTEELKSVSNQIKAEGSVFGDSVGSSRMLIWKQSISLLPDYWLFGCGIECLGNHCHEGVKELWFNFDKVHNEYLNLWVTEGIIALVFYLIFLFALFIPGLKQFFGNRKMTGDTAGTGRNVKSAGEEADGKPAGEEADGKPAGEETDGKPAGEETDVKPAGEETDGKPAGEEADGKSVGEETDGKSVGQERDTDRISKIAFFAFFGYIAQAFFNISVVQVAPYFWMICGLLYRRKRDRDEEAMGR